MTSSLRPWPGERAIQFDSIQDLLRGAIHVWCWTCPNTCVCVRACVCLCLWGKRGGGQVCLVPPIVAVSPHRSVCVWHNSRGRADRREVA